MLYDRIMKNIQNRHNRIWHMNSFINTRLQRKLRKCAEIPLSGSRVSGLTVRVLGLGSHFQGAGSRVSLFGYAVLKTGSFQKVLPNLYTARIWQDLVTSKAFRSSRLQMFYKIGALENLQKSAGNHLVRVTFQ